MRCPVCGQWNRASLPNCVKCGAQLPLQETEQKQPGWRSALKDEGKAKAYMRVDEDGEINTEPDARDSLADEMAELKKRKEMGARQQRRLRQESAQRGSAPSGMTIRTHTSVDTFWSHIDEQPEETESHRNTGSRTTILRGGTEQKPDDSWTNSQVLDPLWTERPSYDSRGSIPRQSNFKPHLPKRHRHLRRFLYTLTMMMLGALLVVGGYYGYQWYQAHKQANSDANKALISASIKNNLAAHTIQIPGEDGQQIYVRELHTNYMVIDGYATVEIEDHTWYDEIPELQAESMTVSLTPFVQTAAGQQKPLDIITYDVEIPLSPITLISPDALRSEVVAAMYSLKFTVRPGSTVYMNEKNISDTVDSSDGAITYNATVQPIGDNVFTLRVRSPYCRESSLTVTLYREPQEIPLDLAADTYTSTTLRELQINATTLPGATIEVLSNYTDLNITKLDSTGEFSFYAVFDQIGNNTITIAASYPGKKTSVVNYNIYYVPTAPDYTMKAWPLSEAEYAELVSNITYRAAHNQVYVVMAKLAYIVSDKPQMGVFYTSTDGKSQPVLVENFTNTTWQVGTYYRIYGDAYGTYDSMPWLCGRYTYKY